MRPTFAPFLSIKALVASVVPWITISTSDGDSLARSKTFEAAAIKPFAGLSRVVKTLLV